MTRAKRVTEGERTQHDVPIYADAEGRPFAPQPVRETLPSVPEERLCKNCAKAAASTELAVGTHWAAVTAPSGTRHLAEGPGAPRTLCGADATKWGYS